MEFGGYNLEVRNRDEWDVLLASGVKDVELLGT